MSLPIPPLPVDLLAQALYAAWRARDDVTQRVAIIDRWRQLEAQGLNQHWLAQAAHVLAWVTVLATPAEETVP